MDEHDIIRAMAAAFPRSPRQANAVMTCDAELIHIGETLHALSIDEFSAEEDQFDAADPDRLAHNLATATLSDIYAAGGEPRFFMQALVLPPTTAQTFVEAFAAGLARTLNDANCAMIGGDVGAAPAWRFTAWCMGPVTRPLTRLLPDADADLWVSGPLGDANAAIAGNLPTPQFELRLPLIPLIHAHATACTDTSGGLWDALWTLTSLNPRHRFTVELDAVPLAPLATQVCRATGIPTAAALIGGAGEYEYLFAAPSAARTTLAQTGATRIGAAEPSARGAFLVRQDGRSVSAPPCPDPRAYPDRAAYRAAVITAAGQLP